MSSTLTSTNPLQPVNEVREAAGATPLWKTRTFWYAEAAALSVRVLFIAATAGMRKSADIHAWKMVAEVLKNGGNPYATTTFLNWPPFWLQIIFWLNRFSETTGTPFVLALQSFLVLTDLALIAALYALLRKLSPDKPAGSVVLFAVALNPVFILVSCQHGNFDGVVALTIVLFLLALTGYQRQRQGIDWLLSCFFLGLAILIKTTPAALLPLLLVGADKLDKKTKLIGGTLAMGPVLLGVSIIYVLSPAQVSENVLGYRSTPGYFGITGLLGLMKLPLLSLLYQRGFPVLLAATLLALGAWIHNRPEQSERFVILTAASAMLAIPLLGPGYGPQYLLWSIPLLAAVYHLTNEIWIRNLFIVAYEIAALTYLIEYSFFLSHGALAEQLWPNAVLLQMYAEDISTPGGQTLVRLALFAILLAVFSVTVRDVRRSATAQSSAVSPGE